jgi:hypothetical protein
MAASAAAVESISDNEYYVNFVARTGPDSLPRHTSTQKTARPPLKGAGPMGRN